MLYDYCVINNSCNGLLSNVKTFKRTSSSSSDYLVFSMGAASSISSDHGDTIRLANSSNQDEYKGCKRVLFSNPMYYVYQPMLFQIILFSPLNAYRPT